MAVTYADLVAFGFAYVEDNAAVNIKNQKFVTKTAAVLSPRETCLCAEEDFIIFAEFSEVKGPVALVTVPSHIQQDENIDINSFIMRIMSVDYQANPGGKFCICQDTQVLQTYVSHNRHAYVHYFTLYDLYARGFVRPLCLAYVSTDQRKLHRIFPQLREHFLKTTELMKVDNRRCFSRELSLVLSAIKEIHLQYITATDNVTLENNEGCSGESVDDSSQKQQVELLLHQCLEFNHMLHTVEASLEGCEYAQAVLDHWSGAFSLSDDIPAPDEVQEYIKVSQPDSATCRKSPLFHQSSDGTFILDKQLRPIPFLNPWGTASALWRLTDVIRVFGNCSLSTSLGAFPRLSGHKVGVEWTLGCTDEVDVDTDCAWEALAQPDFLNLLFIFSLNAKEASTLTQDEADSDRHDSVKEVASGNEGSSSYSYHSISDSIDEIPTLTTTKNSAILDSDEQAKESYHTLQQSTSLPESYGSVRGTDCVSITSAHERGSFYSVDGGCTPIVLVNSKNIIPPQKSVVANGKHKPVGVPHFSDGNSDNNSDDSESFHDILEVLHSDDNWSQDSADEEHTLGVSWNHCLWTRYRPLNKPGHRLLKFFWTYQNVARHVVYSLLTGRTLVLAGDAQCERRVSRIMNALSPLIPPLDAAGLRILRWHRGILVSAHIASYQVIGVCVPERLSIHDMISPRDKNCVTILDVKTDQISGPAYHGHLLSALGNNVRDFPSDQSLLIFIQSVLVGIGRKLRAYKDMVAACNTDLPSHACRQLDLHGCDADIVRYLSKLPL